MRNSKDYILLALCWIFTLGFCGHYPVPEDATIHRFYFEDTDFDDALELEWTRDDPIWINRFLYCQ